MLLGLFAIVVALLVTVVQVVDRDRAYRAYMAEGDAALAAGSAFTAVEAYSQALGARADSVAAYLRRGQAYHSQQRDEEAIRDWHEASRLAPRSTPPLELLGDLFSRRGEDAQAASYYERSVALDAQDAARLYKLALARYRAGAPQGAVDPLRRAVMQNDNFAEAWHLLGLVLRDTQATAEAAAALEHAVRVAPTLSAAREELADLYRAAGRPVDELAQLQALASLDPSLPREIAIALAEVRHGDEDGAIATLTAAATRDPGDSQLQVALGRVYLAKAERTLARAPLAAAMTALEAALGGTARRSEGLMLYGRALTLQNDLAGAERILREATATSPLFPDAFGYLADACDRQGKYADAHDALARLDALQGDTASAPVRAARARRLGALALKAGDAASALADLQRAVDAGITDAGTLGSLAEAQWKTGRQADAIATLTQALALEPRNADLRRLARVIR